MVLKIKTLLKRRSAESKAGKGHGWKRESAVVVPAGVLSARAARLRSETTNSKLNFDCKFMFCGCCCAVLLLVL